MPLILRRANVSRASGSWQHEDDDVFDGDREVGRIYRLTIGRTAHGAGGVVSAHGPETCGHAQTLADAKAAGRRFESPYSPYVEEHFLDVEQHSTRLPFRASCNMVTLGLGGGEKGFRDENHVLCGAIVTSDRAACLGRSR
jgi:hypothetical protein